MSNIGATRALKVLAVAWLFTLVAILGALGVTRLAGLRLDAINSDSMAPGLPRNALAAVQPVDVSHIETGDVIAFRLPSNRRTEVLHRVVAAMRQSDGLFFETKGDANKAADPLLVPDDDVLGRMSWHVPYVGAVVLRLQPPIGYLVLVGSPLAMLVASELLRRRRASPSTGAAPQTYVEGVDAFQAQLIGA